MTKYKPPELLAKNFHCLHCGVLARQYWQTMTRHSIDGLGNASMADLTVTVCEHCDKFTLWAFEELVYPRETGIPAANQDLDADMIADYDEARLIAQESPRGAVALLRLCIQKLCKQLGQPGKNINDDIAGLVNNGLPVMIQQALDVVRVVGNNAVHPGQIDLKDDRQTAVKLFELVNIIAQVMITQPKQVQALYGSLPATQIDAINKRDQGSDEVAAP